MNTTSSSSIQLDPLASRQGWPKKVIKMTVIILQLRKLRPRQGNYTPSQSNYIARQSGRPRCQEAGLALCLSSFWETRTN